MWSSTVAFAWSASSRTSELRVVARTWATTENTWPWASLRMFANFWSKSGPVAADMVARKPICCAVGWLGRVMPNWGAIVRHVESRFVCPSIRCCPARLTAGVVPFCRAICPAGNSHRPASRTLVTKVRSSWVSGPYCVDTVWAPAAVTAGLFSPDMTG